MATGSIAPECTCQVESLRCVLQMLLEAHQAWYHMQRCKDQFEALLSIDKLKKGFPPAAVPPHPPRRAPVPHPGRSLHLMFQMFGMLVHAAKDNIANLRAGILLMFILVHCWSGPSQCT